MKVELGAVTDLEEGRGFFRKNTALRLCVYVRA